MSRGGARSFAAALTVAVSAAIAVPVSGASAAPTSVPTATKPTACQVLKRAEIRRVVDDTVQRSKEPQHTPKSATVCNWDIGGRNTGAIVSVWVQRGRPAREGYDVSVRVFGADAEEFPEFGDAFYSPTAGALYVLRGSEFLYVQRLDESGAVDPAVLRDQTIELTEHALERL